MSVVHPHVPAEPEALVAESRLRLRSPLAGRDRVASLGLAGVFLAVSLTLALLLAHVPDVALGRMHPERAAVLVGSSRHALGPALVLTAVAGHGPRFSDWPVYIGALVAQFAIDAGGFLGREWLITRLPPRV